MSRAVPFRVIDTGIRGARANIAFDQALIDARRDDRIPNTIRFLRFRPSALIGMHQILSHEVRVDYCRNRNIEIGRRITGGGGLYLDEGQIGWELVFRRADLDFTDLHGASRCICEAAVRGLNKLGVAARYRPRNDIEVGGRKIGGTGGFFDGDVLFYQGTILIDFDPLDMIAALRVPIEKLSKRDLTSACQRVITLREALGAAPPPLETIYSVLLDGFTEGLGIDPTWGAITAAEEALAARLHDEEIGRDDFVTQLDAPEIDNTLRSASITRRGGSIRADVRLEGPARSRIREILLTGDFFVTPPRAIYDLEAALRGRDSSEASAAIDGFFSRTPVEFLSLGPRDIRDAVEAALGQIAFRAAGHALRGHWIGQGSPNAPTLVFLHDALGCARLWRDLPEQVAAASGCRALVYDRWGSGDSAPLEPPVSPRYLLDEALVALPDVLAATGIRNPILIGHSDGAAIALAYAGAFPGTVSGVIAIAPHFFPETRTARAIADQIADFERGDLKARLARYHGSNTEALFQRLVAVWTAPEPRDWGIEPYLRRIACPVLAIQGTEDEFFTRRQIGMLVTTCPGPTETLFLEGCGHAPQRQVPKAVSTALVDFILGLRPSRAPQGPTAPGGHECVGSLPKRLTSSAP